ncbi:MAG TPA: phosphoenolpyruvate synthase [Pirellulaceae bacterium]|nr:phosphoenolpyruvate synthase [Pirellulaceae bacterium]
MTAIATDFVRPFSQIGIGDVPVVGGKNASLGEMFQHLSAQGVRVPDGFATTADAYRAFLSANKLDQAIADCLAGLDLRDVQELQIRGHRIRQMIVNAPLPDDLQTAIVEAYRELTQTSAGPDVAVRSSATAEDLPDASFAGQQETYLNVQGEQTLLDTCRRCFASLFTDRAISYRADKGFSPTKIALSVGVQLMVRSDLGASGVMFSIDTESGFRDAVLINAAYGLGENVVQGAINPDEYYVFKPTLLAGYRPIVKKTLGSKEFKMIYDIGGGKMTKNVPVAPEDRGRFAISDDDILQLARWACLIEAHYSQRSGHPTPMDMEWAKDGRSGELFIVQARPETVQSLRRAQSLETYHLDQRGQALITGRAVGERIGCGKVRVIRDARQLATLQAGEVLVTDKTDPDWEPVMKRAAAIITNRGGRTCHAAIVSRELGLPAIVGTLNATEQLANGEAVTVCCSEGDTGHVYAGELPFHIERVDLSALPRPKTKIMMNVGNPDEVFTLAQLPNDGVGLARMEFIISNSIKVHPLALLQYDQLTDRAVRQQIDGLTRGFAERSRYFVETLARGVALIAAAFYPRDVIVRMSDFKTNEYANLIGGRQFEPHEENPMLGFRGASRYYDPRFRAAFGLECQAMKQVRNDMGLTNVKLMIPFCRTVEEGRKVQEVMAEHGLRRGQNGLEIYVMCEIPSNVIAATEFAEIFDGFSIGSNDLTQLVLGVDRDSEIVAHVFDERNPAVMRFVAQAIAAVQKAGRKIGICGQAPSDYPEFAQFLVERGIDSISLNPDAVLRTMVSIAEMEARLGR